MKKGDIRKVGGQVKRSCHFAKSVCLNKAPFVRRVDYCPDDPPRSVSTVEDARVKAIRVCDVAC